MLNRARLDRLAQPAWAVLNIAARKTDEGGHEELFQERLSIRQIGLGQGIAAGTHLGHNVRYTCNIHFGYYIYYNVSRRK